MKELINVADTNVIEYLIQWTVERTGAVPTPEMLEVMVLRFINGNIIELRVI